MRRGMMGLFTSTQYLVAISQYKCGSWVHVAARILIAISRIANKVSDTGSLRHNVNGGYSQGGVSRLEYFAFQRLKLICNTIEVKPESSGNLH